MIVFWKTSMRKIPVPEKVLPFDARSLVIEWDDGVAQKFSYETLRKECPCATCREVFERVSEAPKLVDSHFQLRLIPKDAPSADPILRRVDWIGNYAIRLVWEDGHDTGIYDYDLLRRLGEEVNQSEEPRNPG